MLWLCVRRSSVHFVLVLQWLSRPTVHQFHCLFVSLLSIDVNRVAMPGFLDVLQSIIDVDLAFLLSRFYIEISLCCRANFKQ